jgi:hypothetical protein
MFSFVATAYSLVRRGMLGRCCMPFACQHSGNLRTRRSDPGSAARIPLETPVQFSVKENRTSLDHKPTVAAPFAIMDTLQK